MILNEMVIIVKENLERKKSAAGTYQSNTISTNLEEYFKKLYEDFIDNKIDRKKLLIGIEESKKILNDEQKRFIDELLKKIRKNRLDELDSAWSLLLIEGSKFFTESNVNYLLGILRKLMM